MVPPSGGGQKYSRDGDLAETYLIKHYALVFLKMFSINGAFSQRQEEINDSSIFHGRSLVCSVMAWQLFYGRHIPHKQRLFTHFVQITASLLKYVQCRQTPHVSQCVFVSLQTIRAPTVPLRRI